MLQYRDVEKSRTTRVNQFKTLCLTLMVCVEVSTAANAGSYTVNYSGRLANFNDAFITGVNGYTDVPYTVGTNGFYGGGGTARWQGGSPPTSAHVTCEGQITATFAWQPTGNSTDDPPPDKVVIAQQCNTSMSSYSYSQATGTADNALGFPFVQDANVSDSVSGQSNGSLYQIKDAPGLSFTITCSPNANVAGIGPNSVPVSWSGSAGVSYKATALPLELVLNGGIGTRNQKSFLVGQQVSGTVSTGGLTAFGFNWTVSGSEPFKNWIPVQYPNKAPDPQDDPNKQTAFSGYSGDTASQTAFCFRKYTGNQATVSSSLHLAVPAGAKPSSGFDVTLQRNCYVDKPSNTLAVYIGSVQGIDSHGNYNPNPVAIQLQGATDPNSPYSVSGILWDGTVTTPTSYGSGGGWNYTQLITPHRLKRIVGVDHLLFPDGQQVLDSTFGYEPEYFSDTPNLYPDGSNQVEGDSPGQEFYGGSYIEVLESFETYTLYTPPGAGSQLVPLKNLNWYWQAQAHPDSSGIYVVSNTDAEWSFEDDFPTHPMWTDNVAPLTFVPPIP